MKPLKTAFCSMVVMLSLGHTAYAKDRDAVSFTSANTIKEIYRVDRACRETGMYEGILYISGTWNGNTVTFLTSPDDGASKFPVRDKTRTIISVTSDEVLPSIKLGRPSGNNTGTIIYASTDGSATDPDLSVFLQDCE